MSNEKKILNHLIDKYENSKSFTNTNKVNQHFRVKITRLFPKYADQSDYETFSSINESISFLERKGYVKAEIKRANVCESVCLNTDMLDEVYEYLGRIPKRI